MECIAPKTCETCIGAGHLEPKWRSAASQYGLPSERDTELAEILETKAKEGLSVFWHADS